MKKKLIGQFWIGTTVLLLMFFNASIMVGQENVNGENAKK